MDIIVVVAAVVLFLLAADKLDTKKPPAKPPESRQPGPVSMPPPMPQPWPQQSKKGKGRFDIPPIQGAPTSSRGSDGVYREAGTEIRAQSEAYARETAERNRYQAYLEEKKVVEARERAAEQAAYAQGAKLSDGKAQPAAVNLQSDAMQLAVVYAEFIGRPKAQRGRNPYFRK